MKQLLTIVLFVGFSLINAQNMDNKKLNEIYTKVSDTIQGDLGAWQFHINDIPIISFTDENHNRMRIISPIAEVSEINDDVLKASLIANFHTALDVKYAISDGIMWAVFIHPLKELSEEQVTDAISQVYYAHTNFGTTYASTSLVFPGNIGEEKKKEKKTFKKQRI